MIDEDVLRGLSKHVFTEPIYPDEKFPPSPYYRFFKILTRKIRPLLSVELGVCGGGAGLYMAQGWPKGIVVGVDCSWDHQDNIIHIIKNFPNYHFMFGDSILLSEKIFSLFGEIDVLFIDTIHTYERTMREYASYVPFLSERAIICLDDLKRDGMERAWNEIPGKKIRMDYLHAGGDDSLDGGFGAIIHNQRERVVFNPSDTAYFLLPE